MAEEQLSDTLAGQLDEAAEVILFDLAAAHAKPAQRPLVLVHHLRRAREIERALTVVGNRRMDATNTSSAEGDTIYAKVATNPVLFSGGCNCNGIEA